MRVDTLAQPAVSSGIDAPYTPTTQGTAPVTDTPRVLRLAFVGTGWIGTQRMQSLIGSHDVQVAAIVEPVAERARCAAALIEATPPVHETVDSWLGTDPECDGVVIASPSALHARQAIAVLEAGMPVFVQKPMARSRAEAQAVVDAARHADRALDVDFSYRGVSGLSVARRRVSEGEIGRVYAAELTFHNAYAPDKGWAHERALSGGGCVMDLGCHLVDLLTHMVPDDPVLAVQAARFAKGQRLTALDDTCEDFAVATLQLQSGLVAQLTCSWHAHAGVDAVIEAVFHGTRGSVRLVNECGSFTRIAVQHNTGSRRETLGDATAPWGGVEIGHWADRVARGGRFCAERASRYLHVADVLDRINAQ